MSKTKQTTPSPSLASDKVPFGGEMKKNILFIFVCDLLRFVLPLPSPASVKVPFRGNNIERNICSVMLYDIKK